ncbi:hypothetical protein JTB14_011554 [Gonioctena quinquepunctata]|nr:hypothetical protein JTB14_011554 [Gonioctena quinquepunctata]
MASVFPCVVAILLVVNAANGLKCYSCNTKDQTQCNWGLVSFTFNTEECVSGGFLDRILVQKCYKMTATNKAGESYIARGCLPAPALGCSALASAAGWLASTSSDAKDSLENLSCETCETDKCNSANKKAAAYTFIGLVLSSIAFLL